MGVVQELKRTATAGGFVPIMTGEWRDEQEDVEVIEGEVQLPLHDKGRERVVWFVAVWCVNSYEEEVDTMEG